MATANGDAREPVPSLLSTLQLAVTHGCCFSTESFQRYASSTHKFILVQGILYAVVGLLCLFIPALVADVLLIPSPEALDLAWFRILGVALSVIGYFYVQGARQVDIKPWVVASTFDRLTFVPVFIGYCLFCGSCPQLCIAFGVLDPLLAVLTHWMWVWDIQKRR